jgi:hypothetical protein
MNDMNEPLPPKKPDHLTYDEFAELRIREAQGSGELDNLPGFGAPIPGIDEPHDELWWIKEKLRREELSILPPSLEILRDVERTLARVATLTTEVQVRRELAALNDRIRDANYRSVNGPPSTQLPLDVEQSVAEWRASRASKPPTRY